MKCKVLRGFIDKETGKAHEEGSTYECTEARFNEIQTKGNYLYAEPEKVAETGDMKPEKATKK